MPTAENAAFGASEAEHRAQLRRAVIASTVGTTIEWYDFLLYGTMTGLVFGQLFFPKSAPLVGEVSRQAWTWIHENQQSERADARKAKANP